MLVSAHRARAGSLILAAALWCASLAPPPASASQPPGNVAAGQREAVAVSDDGALLLAADAPPAPRSLGPYSRFGLLTSPAHPLPTFRALRVTYRADVPDGSAVAVDVRASADGARWTPWATGLASGDEAEFDAPARFAQYRVTLLGGPSPRVRDLALAPAPRPARFVALEDAPPVAPTFTIRATRLGMVGGRTANGHRITKRDRFVALPCRCVVSSNGGDEYMVRVTYRGRSAVAPVYDVGPWNTRDNYWDPQDKRHFSDLRQGWPQDHAAFYEGHNGGRAAKGRVRFPTAMDVGDGIWWDDLGIKGDQAEVEVTFLWMGSDPLAQPPPAPEAAPPPAPEAAPAPAPEAAPPAAPEAAPPAPEAAPPAASEAAPPPAPEAVPPTPAPEPTPPAP